jgi:hypothetical protein
MENILIVKDLCDSCNIHLAVVKYIKKNSQAQISSQNFFLTHTYS